MLMSTDCYSGIHDNECREKSNSTSILYNKTCVAIQTVCSSFGYDDSNTTHCIHLNGTVKSFDGLYKRVLSSEEYFRYGIHWCASALHRVERIGNEPYAAVQRWGVRQKLFGIVPAKSCNCRSRPETTFSVYAGPRGRTSAAYDGNYSDASR